VANITLGGLSRLLLSAKSHNRREPNGVSPIFHVFLIVGLASNITLGGLALSRGANRKASGRASRRRVAAFVPHSAPCLPMFRSTSPAAAMPSLQPPPMKLRTPNRANTCPNHTPTAAPACIRSSFQPVPPAHRSGGQKQMPGIQLSLISVSHLPSAV